CSPIDVLDHCLVRMQIEHDTEPPGIVRGGQQRCLPATCRQAKRAVPELGLGLSENDGQLAEHLRMRVQGVARGAPGLVRQGRPVGAQCLARFSVHSAESGTVRALALAARTPIRLHKAFPDSLLAQRGANRSAARGVAWSYPKVKTYAWTPGSPK